MKFLFSLILLCKFIFCVLFLKVVLNFRVLRIKNSQFGYFLFFNYSPGLRQVHCRWVPGTQGMQKIS